MKKYSAAADRNKDVILSELKKHITNGNLLEIGSGSGQHALYFAKNLPEITWQPGDLKLNHESINSYADECTNKNILPAIELDLSKPPKLEEKYDFIYSANTLHIIPEELVNSFFTFANAHLTKTGTLFVYGPFKYDGNYTSESNRDFDSWLKEEISPHSGIREINSLKKITSTLNLKIEQDINMPANNQLLILKRLN